MVVEFASVEAVREYGPAVLDAGIPLVVASVGAFADEAFLAEMKERAERAGARIYVASGAIGGFDVMRTLALEEGARVTIVNRKAPESLAGAPFLEGKKRFLTRRRRWCTAAMPSRPSRPFQRM